MRETAFYIVSTTYVSEQIFFTFILFIFLRCTAVNDNWYGVVYSCRVFVRSKYTIDVFSRDKNIMPFFCPRPMESSTRNPRTLPARKWALLFFFVRPAKSRYVFLHDRHNTPVNRQLFNVH